MFGWQVTLKKELYTQRAFAIYVLDISLIEH